MKIAPPSSGESVHDAIRNEISRTETWNQAIVQLRIERRTPEGVVVATPITKKQAVRLTEIGLLAVRFCEPPELDGLREVTLYPADWAKLLDELRALAAKYDGLGPDPVAIGGKARGGGLKLTRVYDIPVVSFIPGFVAS